MTSQETVPRRLGCPDSPAKAWQNCQKLDLRGKCLSPGFRIFVSGNGRFALLFYSPIPAWSLEDQGRVGSPGSSFVQGLLSTEKVGWGWSPRVSISAASPVLSCTSCESQWRCHFFPTSTSLWLLSVILLTQSGLSNPTSVTCASKLSMIWLTIAHRERSVRPWLHGLGYWLWHSPLHAESPSSHQEHSPCLHVGLVSAETDTNRAISGTQAWHVLPTSYENISFEVIVCSWIYKFTSFSFWK